MLIIFIRNYLRISCIFIGLVVKCDLMRNFSQIDYSSWRLDFMDYQPLYTHLFNSITDTLAQMQKQNYGLASETLMQAQRNVESMYLDMQENEEE